MYVGTWLSLVEHSLGVRGVGSSNLPVPTSFSTESPTSFGISAFGFAQAGSTYFGLSLPTRPGTPGNCAGGRVSVLFEACPIVETLCHRLAQDAYRLFLVAGKAISGRGVVVQLSGRLGSRKRGQAEIDDRDAVLLALDRHQSRFIGLSKYSSHGPAQNGELFRIGFALALLRRLVSSPSNCRRTISGPPLESGAIGPRRKACRQEGCIGAGASAEGSRFRRSGYWPGRSSWQ